MVDKSITSYVSSKEVFLTIFVNKVLVGMLLLVITGLPASLIRWIDTGFLPIYAVQICLSLVIIYANLFKDVVSLNFKGFLITSSFMLIGLSSVYTFGLSGLGALYACVCGYFSNLLWGSKLAIKVTTIYILLLCIIAFLYINNLLAPSVDLNIYILSIPSWLINIISLIMITFILIGPTEDFIKQHERLVHEISKKNKDIITTQKQLIQSSKMASLGTLTAGMAHEINNPTNFAHAAVYMMQDEIVNIKTFLKELAGGNNAEPEVLASFDDKFEKLSELTKTATEGTIRIKTIVEDLRTFARLDDAKQEKVHLSDLINSTLNLVQTQYDLVVIEKQCNYDPLFLCFPSQLKQVFMNIIVNSCQAIDSKNSSVSKFEGKVVIRTEQIENKLVMTFEDNGCGMGEQILNRIFEPFFTTKSVGSGTGLGMAISFGIIDEHSGRIEVKSTEDVGTKTTIIFDV